MKNRRYVPLIVYLFLLVIIFSWANNLFGENLNQIPYSQVVELFRLEQVKAFEVEDEVISMELHTPYDGETTIRASIADTESFRAEMSGLFVEQLESGVLTYYNFIPEEGFSPF